MHEIHTEIEIKAPRKKVWEIFTDFESYPHWNPFIRSLEGDISEGGTLRVEMEPHGSKPMKFRPTVLAIKPQEEFRWKGKLIMPGIFDGEHIFRFEKINGNTTKFIQREKFTGIAVSMLLKNMEEGIKKSFEEMNTRLKNIAED